MGATSVIINEGFNTVNGKYCCNPIENIELNGYAFQYRKR